MRKKRTLILFSAIATLLTSCSRYSAQDDILYFSGVSIPTEATLRYSFTATGFGHQGHGPRFFVFSFKEEPTEFFTSDYQYGGRLIYTDKDGTKHYAEVISGTLEFNNGRMDKSEENAVSELLVKFNINEEYLPIWENEYTYFTHNLNLFVYFTETKTLSYLYKGY